jgi:hypothetical protein
MTGLLFLLWLAQLPSPALTPSEPFSVVASHAGADTQTFNLIINNSTVDTLTVGALVGGDITFRRANGMPEGTYQVRIDAVGPGGTTLSLPIVAQPGNCKEAPKVTISTWDRSVSLRDPDGMLLKFKITGPSRVVRAQIDLVDDGTPGWEILFSGALDGRDVLGISIMPSVIGRFTLMLLVADDRGCTAIAPGNKIVQVVQ